MAGKKQFPRVNKLQVIEEMSQVLGDIDPKVINRVLQVFTSVIENNIVSGNKVNIHGFGTFYPQHRKAHQVQFKKNGFMDDYTIMKFSSSLQLNRRIDRRIKDKN